MTHQIIATIGLFLGIVYGSSVVVRAFRGARIDGFHFGAMGFGFTTFIAAMWIF